MYVGNAMQALSDAVGAAVHRDLSPIGNRRSRPHSSEVEVVMFPQTWSSTSLGYGGIGGQMMTTAYTVIVTHDRNEYCVYFGSSRLAYKVELVKLTAEGREDFRKDMANHCMKSRPGNYQRKKEIKDDKECVTLP